MFIAFSYSIRLKSELRVDGVLNMMPAGLRRMVELIELIVCLAVTVYLFINSFEIVNFIAKTGVKGTAMPLSMKYVYASTVVGFGLAAFRYIQKLVLELQPKKKTGKEENK
jgi:TRAP-type C4-dicarboxylate transport system permease small subunit